MGGDGPWPTQNSGEVRCQEAGFLVCRGELGGRSKGATPPWAETVTFSAGGPLAPAGGRPDSQWHQPFREVVLFFILFFLRHDSYPLESWVEEGVGGACVYVGVGGLCGWPVITSWTRVGPPGWESRAAMSR